MVLIFSTSFSEISTEQVIDWLDMYNVKWIRINGDDFIKEDLCYDLNNITLKEKIDFGKIKVVWFRRIVSFEKLNELKLYYLHSDPRLYHHYKNEYLCLFVDIFYFVKSKCHKDTVFINEPKGSILNKLTILRTAQCFKIPVPKSFVSNNPNKIIEYMKLNGLPNVIIKPLSDIFTVELDNKYYSPYSSLIGFKELKVSDLRLLPSLVQEPILKIMEFRVVYFDDKFYSMAILSSNNDKTSIDFRNYDIGKMNYRFRCDLPVKFQKKLKRLVDHLELKFCSIDLIYNGKEYVFLEINPVGQFGMTSLPCQYGIEKILAQYMKRKCYEK